MCIWVLLTALAHVETSTPVVYAAGESIPNGHLYLPMVQGAQTTPEPTPTPDPTPEPSYDAIPTLGSGPDHPPDLHGDLNLGLRGYRAVADLLDLLDLHGPTDRDAPQLAGLFNHQRGPEIDAVYQVYDWNWACDEHGCRGDVLTTPAVSLLGLRATVGEPLFAPSRRPEIYGGGYIAMVLYAAPARVTLAYTREDTAAIGYVVHLESIAVEPALLALYQRLDSEGRERLPALRAGERLGRASETQVRVAVRDTGSFMEPRSRKDWWVGY